MRELSDHTIMMLVFRDPQLKIAADRYKLCWALLPEAVRELDETVKRRGLNSDIEDDAEVNIYGQTWN